MGIRSCLEVGIEAYGGRGLRIAASLALLAMTEKRDDVGIVPYMAYGMSKHGRSRAPPLRCVGNIVGRRVIVPYGLLRAFFGSGRSRPTMASTIAIAAKYSPGAWLT